MVEKIAAWLPVSAADIVDFGVGTAEDEASAAARIAAERAELDAMWRALPWYVRLQRTVRMWRWHSTEAARDWLHSHLFPDCDGEG